jgi:hypothetical protein
MSSAELLILVEEVLQAVKRHAQVIGDAIKRKCTICGFGYYQCIVNEDTTQLHNFGLNAVGNSAFKIFTCAHLWTCPDVFIQAIITQISAMEELETRTPRSWCRALQSHIVTVEDATLKLRDLTLRATFENRYFPRDISL